MSDEKIEVAFTAQLQDLLTGLGKAQSSVKEATEGMTGSVSDLAETFEKMGGAAVALAGVGLAFEALKIGVDYAKEAAEQTRELAESFKNLGYETGASLQDLNAYTMAMEMSGGKVGDLEHLMVGMQRGIKANSEALVANGVAANEAALKGMTFEQYLTRVSKIADDMATPTDREQFLIQALGRSGATAGLQIKEFVEHLEKAHELSEKGGIISPKSLEQLEESKQATARLDMAQQKYAASVSSWSTEIGNWFKNTHAAWLEHDSDLTETKRLMDAGQIATTRYGQSLKDLIPEMERIHGMWKDMDRGSSDVGVHNGPKPGTGTDKGKPDKPKATTDPKAAFQLDWANDLEAQKTLAQKTGDAERAANLKAWNAQMAAMAKGEAAMELDTAKDLEKGKENAEKAALAIREQNLAEWQAKQKAAFKEQERGYRDLLNGMTQNWDQAIHMMLHGQLTLSDGFKGAMKQMEDQVEKSCISMGMEWAKLTLLKAVMDKDSHAAETLTNAKDAASGAYAATVKIPYVGPFLAPAAAGVAYAGVMAFAEQGWDRVPSDQVAMIHKNEMVLPASIAEPVRQMAAAGGGGGQTVHIHAMDAPSVQALFRRHQGSLMSVIGEAMRNGRQR